MTHALGPSDRRGARATTVLPAAGRHAPPGTLVGHRLQVEGVATAGLAGLPSAQVVATTPEGATIAHVVPTASLGLHPVVGVDPGLGLLRVTGDVGTDGPGVTLSPGSWGAAVALGRVALGHELVGCSSAMLGLACKHARERIQFDRPIATFQAVRHRLAEALVAVATAEAMLDAAWLDPTPTTSGHGQGGGRAPGGES